ncbi:hypothetical protein ABMA70_14075 [Halobacteriovorax sp. XZX-3]|uniref:hypothetical protein n=1 Tax=unclassified Halobacteriovorax TaxID=2639665 RepID=UPI000CD2FA31|nr:hypothetical protein [Halobacteriovorax sp. DA5]POB13395.1 hypothetical protein C0Z22_09535 [Halobacteriovorax sp. DA5]
MKRRIEVIKPDNFEQENHFYPKALNSQLHPLVSHFFNLDHERIIKRYSHLNPQICTDTLREILSYESKHFFWGGSDLFYVTTQAGNRRMVVLETNSCPSGQKSMPPRTDADEHRGYKFLIENSFIPALKKRKKKLPPGALAVIYDKNYMETSGYASTIADLTGEEVYLVPHFNGEEQMADFENGVLHITLETGERIPIRAAFRYVTQKPWNRIPTTTKTFIFNSTLVCLSGGRNKLLANKAYELYNSQIAESGLKINMPETIKDVNKLEIPLWVQKFGGKAVIKIPYSNAGQGVFTITNQDELDAFMQMDYPYDQFIVQSLIGHYEWSSTSEYGKFFHIGTVPNKKGNIYIADLRLMVYSSPKGFMPCAVYARRASKPLEATYPKNSWEVLGTNLSVKKGENLWDSDTSRLMLMDQKDFNSLGIGTDDLIEAYIQTILTIVAIDKMAEQLISKKGTFRTKLFRSLDNDNSLFNEIMIS